MLSILTFIRNKINSFWGFFDRALEQKIPISHKKFSFGKALPQFQQLFRPCKTWSDPVLEELATFVLGYHKAQRADKKNDQESDVTRFWAPMWEAMMHLLGLSGALVHMLERSTTGDEPKTGSWYVPPRMRKNSCIKTMRFLFLLLTLKVFLRSFVKVHHQP